MASAYAALVSLVHVLNRIQYPGRPVHFEKSQIHCLFRIVSTLLNHVESYSEDISKELQRRISNAAFEAEDTIESYLTDQIRANFAARTTVDRRQKRIFRSDGDRFAFVCRSLRKVIGEMKLIIQESMEADQLLVGSTLVGSSVPPNETINTPGFDKETDQLLEQLTRHQTSRQIIPVVGMGGIGKTTLAINVYKCAKNFDVRAWVTFSQSFTVEKIIRCLLRDIGVGEVGQMCDEELGELLHKGLWRRRYLIVLDDIWDSRAWDTIRRFCPDGHNGSRILLTTRIVDVASRVGTCSPYVMKLLDSDKSWDLLYRKVFGKAICPSELENCGKEIARRCKGLPLTVVVIGGLLKMSAKTLQHWENVAENMNSILSTEDDGHCFKILSLSYYHLPIHLKPCFLYLATFPEDHEIRVSEIIMLWVADGFLKPCVDSTLEEVALRYLHDLVNRNLVMVKERNYRGDMKYLTSHDLVRDFCIREAQNERFLHVIGAPLYLSEATESQRRLVAHDFDHNLYPSLKHKAFARSFTWFKRFDSGPDISRLNLLRVYRLSGCRVPFQDAMQLVNLRFLRFSINLREQLTSISLLWNLETLIVDGFPYGCPLPREIWHLQHIRHLIFSKNVSPAVLLPDPPTPGADCVFENLQTLRCVSVLSNEVFERIPNIKKLRIAFACDVFFGDLALFRKLECLKLSSRPCHDVRTLTFPNSLRKLNLSGTCIPWKNMTVVGSLPNLEKLELYEAFEGEEWNTVDGEFQSLRFLKMGRCNLVTWRVENCSHFPRLEHLQINWVESLVDIPLVFGESVTLESILVYKGTHSLVLSARQIIEEQQSLGNYDLRVEVHHYLGPMSSVSEMRKELDTPRNKNFHLHFSRFSW